jgi:ADP-ribose pyrophosphatase YjhB (NUDIX family)
VPPGDNRLRHVCEACGAIYYQNPKIVAGCIAEWGDRLLLCRRAIEPRYGLWTLPAGFMENEETALEAAVRETLEEANTQVEVTGLFALFNLPHVNQVYMMFRSRVLDLGELPGSESLEMGLFNEEDIPWDRLAFTTILHTLRFYFEDRKKGVFGFHMGDIIKQAEGARFVPRRTTPTPIERTCGSSHPMTPTVAQKAKP